MKGCAHMSYKESGIDWCPRIPEHWESTKTKYATRFTTGWTPPTGDDEAYNGTNYWANISDLGPKVLESTAKTISDSAVAASRIKPSPQGSLMFSFKLSIGQVSLAGREMYTNEAIATFLSSEKLAIPFAYHAFPVFLVQNAAENIYGAKLLNQELIRAARFPLPPLGEQLAISAFLDRETAKIDALIAEQRRLIELLQEKRQAVISHAVTKGLNPNAPMKNSGVEWLGEVPEHWDVLPCRAFLNERDSRNGDYGNDYYLSLVAGKGVIPYDEKGDVGNKKPEDLGKCKLVYEGDFVINSMNYGIGSYGASRFHGVCSPVYIVVTPNEGLVHAGFAFRVLENKWFQRYAQSFGNGILAHRCAISWDILKNIKAGIPPAEEQVEILRHLDEETRRYEQLIATALQQVSLLQERRSALISAAVTGQIDVRGLAEEEA